MKILQFLVASLFFICSAQNIALAQGSNTTPEYAILLESNAIEFLLDNENDIDWFKVKAQQGNHILFRVSTVSPILQDYIFQVETYDPDMTMWDKFNCTITPDKSYFEVPAIAHYKSGEYFIKIYFNMPSIFYFGETLRIQAFINGEPISILDNLQADKKDSHTLYYNLKGLPINNNAPKGQILIRKDGNTYQKIINQ